MAYKLVSADNLKILFDVRYDTAFIQERTRENKEQWKGYCNGINWGINTIAKAPAVDAIPIAVIKRAISGIDAADQCDQAGRYDFELRNALRTVLKWYGSPAYKECERRTCE